MITSHQACQVKGFARRIHRHGAVSRILADRLCRRMMISFQDQIRPDLIGDNHAVIGLIYFHRFFNLPAFPYPATRVMGITEDCHMDMMLFDLRIHIFIIHPPDSFRIFFQRTVNHLISIISDASGKSDISRAVQKHCIPRTCKCL